MKTRLLLILSATLLLSGCATVSTQNTSTDVIQQNLSQADQAEFNNRMNTAKDGVPVDWRNSEGNTSYDLTTSNTRVNGQGLACRNYTLMIDRDYHRKITTSAVACRENGQWKDQS
jgi:surface antigen